MAKPMTLTVKLGEDDSRALMMLADLHDRSLSGMVRQLIRDKHESEMTVLVAEGWMLGEGGAATPVD